MVHYCQDVFRRKVYALRKEEQKARDAFDRFMNNTFALVQRYCPDDPATMTRYRNASASVTTASTRMRSFTSQMLVPYEKAWTVTGTVITTLILLTALALLAMALVSGTFSNQRIFSTTLVLLILWGALRLTWYTSALTMESPILLQVVARLSVVTITVMLAFFCVAWGSAYSELVWGKDVSKVLVIGFAALIVIVSAYAIAMIIVPRVVGRAVVDASRLMLPLTQLVIVGLLFCFVSSVGWRLFQSVAEPNEDEETRGRTGSTKGRTKSSRGRSAAHASSSRSISSSHDVMVQMRAWRMQMILVSIALAAAAVHVIVSFVAEFVPNVSNVMVILLSYLVPESIIAICLLFNIFNALRPSDLSKVLSIRPKQADTYVPLTEDTAPDSLQNIPEQYDV